MTEPTEIIEDTEKTVEAPKARKVSRAFVLVVSLLVLIAVGALGFKGFQRVQSAPDLNYSMDFVEKYLEPTVQPHLSRPAINGIVAAFYKENGHAEKVLSHRIVARGVSPFGDPFYTTKTEVTTQNGPVLVTIKVKNHKGERSIIGVVYQPESDFRS